VKNVLRALRRRKFQAIAAATVIAGAGAVAAVVPAVTASASTAAASTTAAPAFPAKCSTSALRVWLGVPGDGAAGSVYYQLELSNVSPHTCTLYGYPGVSAVGLGGVQLGSAAGRSAGDPEHVVVLTPGATAHALLQVADTGVYSPTACKPKSAIGLRVYPPNDTASQIVEYPFTACSKAGPVYLHVRVGVAGTGIPGYSS
jgi:hypothetical protein